MVLISINSELYKKRWSVLTAVCFIALCFYLANNDFSQEIAPEVAHVDITIGTASSEQVKLALTTFDRFQKYVRDSEGSLAAKPGLGHPEGCGAYAGVDTLSSVRHGTYSTTLEGVHWFLALRSENL